MTPPLQCSPSPGVEKGVVVGRGMQGILCKSLYVYLTIILYKSSDFIFLYFLTLCCLLKGGNRVEVTENQVISVSESSSPDGANYYGVTCSVDVSVVDLGIGTHSFQGYIYPDIASGENLVSGITASDIVELSKDTRKGVIVKVILMDGVKRERQRESERYRDRQSISRQMPMGRVLTPKVSCFPLPTVS